MDEWIAGWIDGWRLNEEVGRRKEDVGRSNDEQLK